MGKLWKKLKGCHMRSEHPARMLNREIIITTMPVQPGFPSRHSHHHHGHGAMPVQLGFHGGHSHPHHGHEAPWFKRKHHGHGAPWFKKKHLKFHKHKFTRCNFHGHHFSQHGFHGLDEQCGPRNDDHHESGHCSPSNHDNDESGHRGQSNHDHEEFCHCSTNNHDHYEHGWHRNGHRGHVFWICGHHERCCDVQRNQGADASQRQNETSVPNEGDGEPSAPQE